MDLSEFKSGTPATKPWLNIVCNDIKSATATVDVVNIADLTVDEVNTNAITLVNQAAVPNPAVGSRTIYTDLTGVIHAQTPLGASIAYINESDPVVSVQPAAAVVGNLPRFTTSDGKTIGDSGISIDKLGSSVDSVSSAVSGIAPAGHRDQWTNTTSLTSTMSQLGARIYSSAAAGAAATNYSNDYGANWAAVGFDVAPSGPFPIMSYGYDGIGTYVALSETIGDPAYTSVAGVAFTAGAVPPDASGSVSILWVARLGLFITGTLGSDTTKYIMTSPDGVTWTLQTTPDFGAIANFVQIVDNGSILVAVVHSAAPGSMWSTDGITWTAGTPGIANMLAWSGPRQEWIASTPSADIYSSSDGKSWDLASPAGGVPGSLFCIWVDSQMRYYTSAGDPFPTNAMRLWSTSSPYVGFSGSYLDGAHSDNQGYSQLIYVDSASRFVVGAGQYGVVYSTAKPFAVKSMHDQIKVRGMPAVTAAYSSYGTVNVNNTIAETTIAPTGTSIGSLFFPAPLPIGSVINVGLCLLVSSVAGDTLTINFKMNGNIMASSAIPVAALTVNGARYISGSFTVVSGGLLLFIERNPPGTVTRTLTAFNGDSDNEMTITATWGANVNQLAAEHIDVSVLFPNGA